MADPVTHEDTEELVGAPRGSVQDTISCKGIEGGLQASGIVSESVAHKLAYSDLLFHNIKNNSIIFKYGKRADKKADLGFDGRKGRCAVPETCAWENPQL